MKTVKFLEDRHATFGRELVKAIASFYRGRIDAKRVKREYEQLEGLGYTTADASYCLNNTARILMHIGILPSED